MCTPRICVAFNPCSILWYAVQFAPLLRELGVPDSVPDSEVPLTTANKPSLGTIDQGAALFAVSVCGSERDIREMV